MRYIVFLLTLLISVNAYALVNWNNAGIWNEFQTSDTVDITLDEDEVGLSITANSTQTSDLVQMFASDGTTHRFSITGTGQIQAIDGSVSAPSYSFASDPDTGMHWASNTISFTAGGVQVLTINNGTIDGKKQTNLQGLNVYGGNDLVLGGNGNIGNGSTQNPTNIYYDGKSVPTPQSVSCTCSDDPTCGSDATAGTLTLEPTSNSVRITNADPNGCDVTLSETNAVDGHMIAITVVSNAGGTVDFSDTSGVTEMTGAVTLDLWDTLDLEYVSDRWVERGSSNN